MSKNLVSALLFLLLLGGCLKREIYTEIADHRYIAHPPSSLQINNFGGMLKCGFKNDPTSPINLDVYVHCAKCTNAQSKSLGADFDGFIRITLSEGNHTIARAQMDYKGEATDEEVAQVYTHLMEKLQWNHSV